MSLDDKIGEEKWPVEIIELSPDDWQLLRDLKLRSLQEEPVAFEDSTEGRDKYAKRSETEWRDILSGKMSRGLPGESVNVFARSSDHLVGMVSAIIPESDDASIAKVQHMYVAAEVRGHGMGRSLLSSLFEKLKTRPKLRKIKLEVVASQIPAVELYRSLGFTEKGRHTITRSGGSYEEIEMEMTLPPERV